MSDKQASVDNLFSDDDVRLETPSHTPRRNRWPLLIAGFLVVGAGLWWTADINSKKFYLRASGEAITVEKGLYFPFGESTYAPSRAYLAFELTEGVQVSERGPLTAEELDKALKTIFIKIASGQVRDLKKGSADLAEEMIWRAQKLHNISVSDDRKLLKMMGDVAFRRGLSELKDVLSRFEDALDQFQLSAMRGGDQFPNGQKWAESLRRLRSEFEVLARETRLDPDLALGKRSGSLSRQAEESLTPTADDASKELSPSVEATPTGSLVVLTMTKGVKVSVGGVDHGTTPLATPLALKSGLHTVTVTKGELTQSAEVDITRGQNHKVAFGL